MPSNFPRRARLLPKVPISTSRSSQMTRTIPSPSPLPSLLVVPETPATTSAVKCLTINTDNYTAYHLRTISLDAGLPEDLFSNHLLGGSASEEGVVTEIGCLWTKFKRSVTEPPPSPNRPLCFWREVVPI